MSIKFCSLSSGSSGNCQYIETANTKILVDGGFSGKRIEGLLSTIGVSANELDGILVTHEHTDHIKGVGVLSRRYDLPIFANGNTWKGMKDRIGKISSKNIRVFTTEKDFNLRDITVYPLKIFHDALEPVGYVIYYKDKKISIVTDTGWVNDHMKDKIKDSDLYLMESNHDEDMVRQGSYPWSLKQRVLSTRGHLSNGDAARVLGQVISGRGEVVLLGHLSGENNLPELAYQTVNESMINLGLKVNNDITLDLTYRDKVSQVYTL